MKNHRMLLWGGLLLLLCQAGGPGCQRSDPPVQAQGSAAAAPRSVKVSVQEILPAPMKDVLLLPGETEAWEDVRVASDMEGVVAWIGPREGQTVKKGELIAKIDVSAKKAALDRAEASFRLSKDLYERRLSIYDRKIISKEELDRAATESALAEANLRQAQVEYERGFLKAPISGVVNHLYVDAGEFVGRGAPVMDIVNVNRIKINLNVPEMDVRFLKAGDRAQVGIDAFPGKRVSGTLDFVAYKADLATKTFRVRVLVENPGGQIRPGMIARVYLLRRVIPEALSAPLFAIVNKEGERLVFVEKGGVAQARVISIGVIEGDRAQITSGLEPNDRLIVAGHTEVEDGMRVQIQ